MADRQSRELSYSPQRFKQTFEWKTVVRRALDGTETRASLRQKPREIYEVEYLLDDEDMRRLAADLRNDLGYTWKLPLWHEPYHTTTEATSGGSTVDGDFADHDLDYASTIYIQPPRGSGEFKTLSGVSGSTLTISGSWGETWPAKSRIFAARSCVRPDRGSINRAQVNAGRLGLKLIANEVNQIGGTGASVDTYNSLPLLDQRPVGDQFQESYDGGLTLLDGGAGLLDVDTYRSHASVLRPRTYFIKDRDALQWWEAFLDQVVGQREPFYAPTWAPDLVLDSQPGSGASSIDVDVSVTDYDDEWWSSAFRHIQMETDTDGEVRREVTAVGAASGGVRTLTLDSALPASGGLTVSRVSFLELSRLGSDSVTFEHLGPFSTVSLSLREIDQ